MTSLLRLMVMFGALLSFLVRDNWSRVKLRNDIIDEKIESARSGKTDTMPQLFKQTYICKDVSHILI
ncbi:MAG: hypothetical protein HKM24_07255 [Gammaproteobacteria bacterium]|nr:hypothetical protein [Gammaproteobacteria bacterium]